MLWRKFVHSVRSLEVTRLGRKTFTSGDTEGHRENLDPHRKKLGSPGVLCVLCVEIRSFAVRYATAGLAAPFSEEDFPSCSSISMRLRKDSISSVRDTLLFRNWMRSRKDSFSGR